LKEKLSLEAKKPQFLKFTRKLVDLSRDNPREKPQTMIDIQYLGWKKSFALFYKARILSRVSGFVAGFWPYQNVAQY